MTVDVERDLPFARLTTIGTGKLTFADGKTGTFDYTVNGVTQSKAITRQVFVEPGTLCH